MKRRNILTIALLVAIFGAVFVGVGFVAQAQKKANCCPPGQNLCASGQQVPESEIKWRGSDKSPQTLPRAGQGASCCNTN